MQLRRGIGIDQSDFLVFLADSELIPRTNGFAIGEIDFQ